MLQGIYHVVFQSSLATIGEVVIVFDACGAHGANESHAFRGVQAGADGALRLAVEICHLQGEKYPSFGELDAINVDLEVSEMTPKSFRAVGSVREACNIRVHVLGKMLAELGPGQPGDAPA